MHPKTEELLWMLFWTCDMLTQPTFRNLTDSFEGWAYRNGFLRQIQRLEREKWLETRSENTGDRVYRLSEAGRWYALGGRDPVKRWNRSWDGRWRLVLFDLPEAKAGVRNRLRDYLRGKGFGYLQKSVWITPDPMDDERALLSDGSIDVESLLLLEARPCAGETDAELVEGAWDFAEIRQRYTSHASVLRRFPQNRIRDSSGALGLQRWLRAERRAWQHVMAVDPLLPETLLPRDYTGHAAWRDRLGALKKAGELMRGFSPEIE